MAIKKIEKEEDLNLEQKVERIEKMCATMLAMLAHIENEPLREALRGCSTPQEVKDLIYAYKEAAGIRVTDCPWR